MKRNENDLDYTKHMIKYGKLAFENYEKFQSGITGFDEDFVSGGLAFCLSQMGEQLAKGKMSEEIYSKYPQLPWYYIRKFRNEHTHTYEIQNKKQIFEVCQYNLEEWIDELKKIETDLISRQ